MLNKIIEFSIRQKLIVGFFTLCLIAWGGYSVTKLPIDAVPDITDNQVQVITVSPSLGALDIERLITFPIEQVNSNIPGIKEMRSFSRFGLSLVTIVFNDDVDVYWARQQVSERLQHAKEQIPKGAGTPVLGPVTTGLGEIYQYVVKAQKGFENKFDATELRTIQDWIVRRQLLGVKGVADVSSFGGKLKQYEVSINTQQLKSYNLSIADVFNALEANNQNQGGSYIEKGPLVLNIRTEGLAKTIADIENISVKNLPNGSPLFIRDIAKVGFGNATRYGAMVYNGQAEVAGAVVMMLKGANSNTVINNVKERIEQIKKTLPEGVEIEPFLDRTKMVNNAIGTVEKNLLEGALIVVFVLVLFLGNFRAGLIVASVIPLSMLVAVILMNLFGVSGNLMSLGALDFGLIVDGAVIIVEAVMHSLYSKKNDGFALNQNQMDAAVKKSASKMMNSAVFGQIIILIVYLPIFALQGIEGKMFKPMAQTVSFALIGAFVLSLTYIPMMSALFLSKKPKLRLNFSDRLMTKLEHFYTNKLLKALQFPKMVIAGALGLFTFAILLLSFMGGEFIPSLEEGDFAVETRVLTGSNLHVSIDAANKASQLLLAKFPEVEKVVAKIGSGEIPTDPMPIEAQDLMIILKDKKLWTSADNFTDLADKMSEELKAIPGVTFGFQYPVQMRFNELMTGARQDVVCKIYGEDLDLLAQYAKQLGKIAGTVQGAKDIWVEPIEGMPQIVINFNRQALAQFGLTVETVNDVIYTAFAGKAAGLVFEGEKRFDLVVRLSQNDRTKVSDVSDLLVAAPNGNFIPLNQLATVQMLNGPNQIQREDAKRRIIVGFNVRGRDVASLVNELKEKTENQLKMQPGYYTTYGGAFENLEHAKKRLYIAVPVALFLIFVMLYFAFGSIKQGLLIYSAIPLSATGGVFALFVRDMPFSISAGIGFIALFGVAVLNGIVLIAEFNRQREVETNLVNIVINGTKTRLRPVLMTASVASLGFLPMALSNGAGAEVQRPLATVVIGGLLIATFLTLFVLPILYIWFNKKSKLKVGAKTLVLIGFVLFGLNQTFAQQPITINAAIDSAIANNHLAKRSELLLKYQNQLTKTAFDLPQTNMAYEFGQINSNYHDNRLEISQSFKFPTVYVHNKKLLQQEAIGAKYNHQLQIQVLKKEVYLTYNELVAVLNKELLLLKADSIFTNLNMLTNLKLKLGDINILENAVASAEALQIKQQLLQLTADKEILVSKFNLLLNTQTEFIPANSTTVFKVLVEPNADNVSENLQVKLAKTEFEMAQKKLSLTKSGLLPDLNLGYSNMSIYGFGNDNLFYNYGSRFSAYKIGIGLPLFFAGTTAKIKSENLLVQATKQQQLYTQKRIDAELKQNFIQYKNNLQIFENYVNQNNANIILNMASLQLQHGEINYINWAYLTGKALENLNLKIEALKNLNNSIVNLNAMANKL